MQNHYATFTPTDIDNYNIITGIEISIMVSKANPEYIAPTGLTATYGQTLADFTLPTGWSWEQALTTPVGNVGTQTHKAKFTPTDTNNYNIITGIDVNVSVTKATQETPAAPTMLSNTNNNITLNAITGCEYRINGAAWRTETSFTGLERGKEYEFEARKAETATHLASPPSEKATFSTTNVGIEELSIINYQLSIYPNPCTVSVFISNAAGADLKIINMLGETVKEVNNLSDLQQIPMDNLSTGIYMFQLTKDANVKTLKVVKN
jgi:hypothetical protein